MQSSMENVEPEPSPIPADFQSSPYDVHDGKGSHIMRSNLYFRYLIQSFHQQYKASQFSEKRTIAKYIYQSVSLMGGRFIDSSGMTKPEGDAIRKIMTSLKDKKDLQRNNQSPLNEEASSRVLPAAPTPPPSYEWGSERVNQPYSSGAAAWPLPALEDASQDEQIRYVHREPFQGQLPEMDDVCVLSSLNTGTPDAEPDCCSGGDHGSSQCHFDETYSFPMNPEWEIS
jgi:hypothetical protein